MTRYLVLLSCGHWFREWSEVQPDASWQPRVCTHHYPRQFEAIYLPWDDEWDLVEKPSKLL